ncbi:hypothetical protein KCU61_g9605, partial [Aureobasidium melanogenum]
MTAKHSLPIETAQIAMEEADLKARPSLTSAIDREVGFSRSFTSDEEKKVLRKIDCVVLPMMRFVFFCQYLDKQSLSYASVAGLIQDLKVDASQYSWCSSIFYIGQLVSEYPFIYLMSRLRLTKLVGFTIVVWGGICMCLAAPVNFAGFAAVRFLLGFSEGAVSPAFVTITSYWYKKEEHALRTALWISMNALAQVVGSLLMFGIAGNKNLTIASWRVMFIVCGAMTVAIGIVFFFAMPSGPQDAWFLNEREKEVLAARMVKCHEGGDRKNFSVAQLREALQDVKVWLIFCFGLLVTMQSPVLTFASLIIKGLGYSSHETLLYVAPSGAVQLALIWIGVVLCASCITAPWSILLSLSASNIKGNTKRSVANAVFFIGYCAKLVSEAKVAVSQRGLVKLNAPGASTDRKIASTPWKVPVCSEVGTNIDSPETTTRPVRLDMDPATDHLSQLLSRLKAAIFAGPVSPSSRTGNLVVDIDVGPYEWHHDIVEKFPPQSVAEFLTSCCYELATDSFFYFDQKDFSAKLCNFYQAEHCYLRNDRVFICLSLMVFALGSQFAHLKAEAATRTPGKMNQPGSYFYRLANRIIPNVAFCCSVDAVQVCLVTAVYLLPEHAYDKAYLYLSHAVRISIALDLYRQKEAPNSTSKGSEVCHRLWWSVYSLDRTISIKLGRAKSVASDIIRTPLPSPLPTLDSEQSFNNVSHQIANAKLVLIMDVIADNVGQDTPNASKDSPQLELQGILPRSEGYRAVLHLHLNYHFAWILTCRSALIKLLRRRLRQFFNEPDEQQDGCMLPLERYAGQCVEAAKAMIDLFETLQRLRYLGMFSYTDFQVLIPTPFELAYLALSSWQLGTIKRKPGSATRSFPDSTGMSLDHATDQVRDSPAANSSFETSCGTKNVASAAINQPVPAAPMLYDDTYLFGLTGLDALDYLNLGDLAHNIATAYQVSP